MVLTFACDNDVIVYPFKKIISYARKNQYIFVAQSIWWISSVIGLTEELITYIDNLSSWELVGKSVKDQLEMEGITGSESVQDRTSIVAGSGHIHPDRISQVDNITNGDSSIEHSDSELGRASQVIKETEEFINKYRMKERILSKERLIHCHTRDQGMYQLNLWLRNKGIDYKQFPRKPLLRFWSQEMRIYEIGRLRVDGIFPIVSERQIYQGDLESFGYDNS